MGINQVHLLGRCGRDPEIRTVGQNNLKVATFSLCTGGKYQTKDGREMDDSAWHNIVAWRTLADLSETHIKKGSQIFIVGHLSYRKYSDKNGVERTVTEIVAERIELCGRAPETVHTPIANQPQPVLQKINEPDDIGDLPPDDDGMPF